MPLREAAEANYFIVLILMKLNIQLMMLTFPVAGLVLQEDYLNVVYISQKVHRTFISRIIPDNYD